MKCEQCKNYHVCKDRTLDSKIGGCSTGIPDILRKITHGDKIRSMSDEELAEFVVRVKLGIEHNSKIAVDSFDVKKQLEWIQSEAESEEV